MTKEQNADFVRTMFQIVNLLQELNAIVDNKEPCYGCGKRADHDKNECWMDVLNKQIMKERRI